VFAYAIRDRYIELTAAGFVSADEAAALFQAVRADPNVPDGLPWLMDLRQYDQTSMTADELQPRVLRMLGILGPKIGAYWAIVIDSQVEHVVKARLLQHLVRGDDATVMLFREMDEARDWLEMMSERGRRRHET
jgi:hypothetical protein